ncbi:hypothetical protein BpHYR1_028529 [Brachionus plicatilis]|uniref:Uncharacterized protein n=1 Tax=Brachionus plicatilis TaxID=10195 RepID=A0A3M7PV86_BRAPC|nr:hypothetical protein BpHYR1_028529 [Brachionus plicatilis]
MKRTNSSSSNINTTSEEYQCLYCNPKWKTDFSDRLKAHYTRFHLDKIKNDPKKMKIEKNNECGIQFPNLFIQNNNLNLNPNLRSKFLIRSKSLGDLGSLNLNLDEIHVKKIETESSGTQTDFHSLFNQDVMNVTKEETIKSEKICQKNAKSSSDEKRLIYRNIKKSYNKPEQFDEFKRSKFY